MWINMQAKGAHWRLLLAVGRGKSARGPTIKLLLQAGRGTGGR